MLVDCITTCGIVGFCCDNGKSQYVILDAFVGGRILVVLFQDIFFIRRKG